MNANNTDISSVVNNLMVVRVELASWGGLHKNREASRRVAQDLKAKERAVKVSLDYTGFHPTVQKMDAHMGHMRNVIRSKTLDYGTRGQYLVTSKVVEDLMDVLSKGEAEFNELRDRICGSEYDDIKAAAQATLGSGWEDYRFPSTDELRAKYRYSFYFLPLPKVGDPIRNLADNVSAMVWARTTQAMEEELNEAIADMYHRVEERVEHMSKTLQADRVNKKGETVATGFHQTLVSNVAEVAKLLINLNPYEDPAVEKLGRDMLDKLTKWDANTLKGDPILRRDVASEADAMLKRLRGLKAA